MPLFCEPLQKQSCVTHDTSVNHVVFTLTELVLGEDTLSSPALRGAAAALHFGRSCILCGKTATAKRTSNYTRNRRDSQPQRGPTTKRTKRNGSHLSLLLRLEWREMIPRGERLQVAHHLLARVEHRRRYVSTCDYACRRTRWRGRADHCRTSSAAREL